MIQYAKTQKKKKKRHCLFFFFFFFNQIKLAEFVRMFYVKHSVTKSLLSFIIFMGSILIQVTMGQVGTV